MAMVSIGEAFSAASSFLGLGGRTRADGSLADGGSADGSLDDADITGVKADTFDPLRDILAPGGCCFEAVAQALTEAGYLDSGNRGRSGWIGSEL